MAAPDSLDALSSLARGWFPLHSTYTLEICINFKSLPIWFSSSGPRSGLLSLYQSLQVPHGAASTCKPERTSCYRPGTLGFSRHASQHHSRRTVSEKWVRGVKDLTQRITKLHAYPVAYGGFSDVWSCLLRHKSKSSSSKRVAVKAIRPVITSDEEYNIKKKAVKQELKIWARLKHRNILPLYGTTREFGPFPAFVCPWADNGTLSEYLEKSGTKLDLTGRMSLLRDIAAGLQYLHSRKIVHGDLSGSNILITHSGRAWLSDFGLSTLVERVSDTVSSGICFPGNIRWAAPELLYKEDRQASRLSTQEADIYSFGSIMLQVLTGKLPFHGIQRVAQIVIMISDGYRPSRERGWDDKDIPDVLWQFVQACWAKPGERPSSRDTVSFIERQLASPSW